ncbi:hypothetical protein PXH59_09825 [Xenorhabdus sp. SF857]|uniref:hypothetical protein n=1 Tax=Xenorhabdus bakwenae TaxID=3026967 RepID=UPI0025582B28|nr:hypothetical protein [Xenorhabdus sp. SF857]WFQ81306.1 hypothetical protein PXH59_09825 [Xenorhabdus sp. SF857]
MSNSTMREYARNKYADIYKLRRDEDPVPYRRDNTGARAANTWLRLFFKKNHRSMKGYTEAPLLAPKAQPRTQPNLEVASDWELTDNTEMAVSSGSGNGG